MKKLVASVGLLAVGTTALKAAHAPGLSQMETSKPWSISASLRGFYDDNYLTDPTDNHRDSYGVEFSPTFRLNIPMDVTYIGLSYTYSLRYYEDRSHDPIDHQHEFEGQLDHSFSERYNLRLEDSFVYSQEPDVVDPSGSTHFRVESNALRNRAKVRFRGDITEVLGVELGFQNLYYDYSDDGLPASRAGLLDRYENLFNIDGRYLAQQDLTAIVGYQFGMVRYTGDDFIRVPTLVEPTPPKGDVRDSDSHYFYVGAEHQFSRQFLGKLKIGAQYTDYVNQDESTWSPYVELSGSYTYLPGSYLQFGLRHTRNSTDVVGVTPGSDVVLDQESTVVYGSVSHRITPQLTGNLIGQFQTASFNGGESDGNVDNYFALGANLEYKITQNWSTEVGYNFDRLDSDESTPRSFSRNRVYLGVRAAF